MTLGQALVVDATTVFLAMVALILRRDLRLTHPILIYLVFHVSVLSVRAFAIRNGRPPNLHLQDGEATRALLYADLFLACLVAAWLFPPSRSLSQPRGDHRMLDDRLVTRFALIAGPIGLVSFALYSRLPGSGLDQASTSTAYQTIAITWPGLVILALIYQRGFKWYLIVPLIPYLAIIGLQGYGRFRFVLPLVFLAQLSLDRRAKRMPSVRLLAGAVALLILFLPLKAIGLQARTGELTAESFQRAVSQSTYEALRGANAEQALFDQYAVSLSLSDRHGRPLLGSPYLTVLTLPIPRPLWPDKPGLADHIKAISSPSRPLATMGAVITLPGDLYLNFRLWGLVLGAFILARLGQRLYIRAYQAGYGSVYHLIYLLLASSLVQPFRDGLSSVPVFLLVHNAPLVALALAHNFVGTKPLHNSPKMDPARAAKIL
jgi:hypothetical protein